MNKYQIIKAPDTSALEIICETYMEMGYTPIGGLVHVDGIGYMQAMAILPDTKSKEIQSGPMDESNLPPGYVVERF